MSDFALDDVAPVSLDWVEPILIDLFADFYAGAESPGDRMMTAKLHTRFLLELMVGTLRNAAFLRLELTAACTPHGITRSMIDAADDAAFDELHRIAAARYRNGSRTGQRLVECLEEAFAKLPARAEPARPSATVRVLANARNDNARDPWARDPWARPQMQASTRLVANG